MTLYEALIIVTDLAQQNALDLDHETEPELREEAEKQETALRLVQELLQSDLT